MVRYPYELVVLVRHGATWNNEMGDVISQEDPPLSELGWQQVAALREWITGRVGTEVYTITSDLRRAKETARGFCNEPIESTRLRERNLGRFTGAALSEIMDYKRSIGYTLGDPTLIWEGIDTVEGDSQICERVQAQIDAMPSGVDSAIIVSHAGVIKALTFDLLGIDPMTPYAVRFSLGSALVFQKAGDGLELTELWQNPHARNRNTA